MTLLGASLAFIFLIAVLGAIRTRLLFEFVSISLLLFKTQSVGKWFYSLVFLPGTILHELSHWLTAELLGVRTGEIIILPSFEDPVNGGREKLGSVQTEKTGPLRSFLIGAAPFFTGVFILWLLGTLLQNDRLWWQYFLIFYGVVVVGSSMLLSREDRNSWPFIGILFFLIIATLYLTPLDLPLAWIVTITAIVWSLNQILGVTVLAILAIIGLTYGMRRIIERIVGKKIVRR